MSNSVQSYMKSSLYWSTYLFIKNRIILEYKVTLLVLKLLSESYIFSVVFVINFSWRKVYFFYFWKPDLTHPAAALTWQKLSDSISVNCLKKFCHLQTYGTIFFFQRQLPTTKHSVHYTYFSGRQSILEW